MPLCDRLLDGLHHATPVIVHVIGSSFSQDSLSNQLPAFGVRFVNGDEDSIVPYDRLGKMEQESLVEHSAGC